MTVKGLIGITGACLCEAGSWDLKLGSDACPSFSGLLFRRFHPPVLVDTLGNLYHDLLLPGLTV